jgi:serine/threonine protein kinase
MGKLLGQGGFAIVREAVHVETGYKVAIKIYDKYKLNKNT